MVKDISNQQIKIKRMNLIEQQKESDKSYCQMMDEIDDEINELGEEKTNLIIKAKTYYKNQIEDIDIKIEENKEEKKKYANAWLSYIRLLDAFKSAKKVLHVFCGIGGVGAIIIGLITTMDISDIPVAIAGAVGLDVVACSMTGIVVNEIIKKFIKLEYFNNKKITEEEMKETVQAKEKEIDPELDKLNETRRDLVNAQQETYKKIDKISEKQEELEISRKILLQEALRNSSAAMYMDDYLNADIKEYCNLISNTSSTHEDKPKVQGKRFKFVGRKIK